MSDGSDGTSGGTDPVGNSDGADADSGSGGAGPGGASSGADPEGRSGAPGDAPVSDGELVEAARRAQAESYAPYSEYVVGAALSTADGRVFAGCNVENANYSNSLHAEEVALGSAVAEGHREFEAVAVSSGERDGVTPCGMCRQTLAEFCDDDFRVICDLGDGGTREYALGDLLPDTIDADTLDRD